MGLMNESAVDRAKCCAFQSGEFNEENGSK